MLERRQAFNIWFELFRTVLERTGRAEQLTPFPVPSRSTWLILDGLLRGFAHRLFADHLVPHADHDGWGINGDFEPACIGHIPCSPQEEEGVVR